jgi:hypothetical protein
MLHRRRSTRARSAGRTIGTECRQRPRLPGLRTLSPVDALAWSARSTSPSIAKPTLTYSASIAALGRAVVGE